MRTLNRLGLALGLAASTLIAHAGPALDGVQEKQATNWHAIVMFCLFVVLTMGITY